MSGSIVTGFDGIRWYNRVVGSYTVANYRDTDVEAEAKGRHMAEQRRVEHMVLDQNGTVVRQTRY